MSAWMCHQRPESASCAFSAAAWSSSEGQMKSGTSPALGCDATGWPQLRPTSSREHFSSPFTFCLPPEPPSNPAELQRGNQYDEWSGFSEWPDNRFHGGSCPVRLTLLLMCVYFRQDVPSRPRLWLVCPSGTLGKLRRGLCDGGASSEARTCSSRGFSKTGMLYNFSFVRAHSVTSGLHSPAGSKGFVVLNFQASESENREDPSDGAARAKKRRRRKKNTEEEGTSDTQVQWNSVRFLLLLASARCFVTKVTVWKQTVKLGAAPADISAPASKKQNPNVSSAQSRCQQLLLSPGLNMHFYPSFNSCVWGGVSLQKDLSRARSLPNPPRRKRPAGKSEARTQDQMQMIVRHGKCNNYQTLEIVSE